MLINDFKNRKDMFYLSFIELYVNDFFGTTNITLRDP